MVVDDPIGDVLRSFLLGELEELDFSESFEFGSFLNIFIFELNLLKYFKSCFAFICERKMSFLKLKFKYLNTPLLFFASMITFTSFS